MQAGGKNRPGQPTLGALEPRPVPGQALGLGPGAILGPGRVTFPGGRSPPTQPPSLPASSGCCRSLPSLQRKEGKGGPEGEEGRWGQAEACAGLAI